MLCRSSIIVFKETIMAAIGMMVGGTLVNALAFTGGNYLFSKLGRSDEA